MSRLPLAALAAIASLAFSTQSFAKDETTQPEGEIAQDAGEKSFFDSLYKEVNAFSGYTSSTTVEGADAPTLLQFGGGITIGKGFGDQWFAGLSSDFRVINQYSDVDATVGNRRGTRWNIVSPTVGAHFGKITVKADFQFLGTYSLTNDTAGGQEASFDSPLGGRVTGLYPVMDRIHLGAMFEYLTFGQQTVGGVETDLAEKLTLWQAGITAAYVF